MALKINHDNAEFKILPEGEYEVFPIVYEKRVARSSGNKMVTFNYIVRDDFDQEGKGQEIRYDNFVESPGALWRIDQASKAAGIEDGAEYEDIYDWAEDFIYKAIRVRVGHREYNGKVYPEVQAFLPSLIGGEYTPPKAVAVEPAGESNTVDVSDDDLPF